MKVPTRETMPSVSSTSFFTRSVAKTGTTTCVGLLFSPAVM